MLKFRKKLYWDLVIKYIIFLIATVMLTILMLVGVMFVTFRMFEAEEETLNNAIQPLSELYFDRTNGVLTYTGELEEGAWIEILHDNDVIYVEGEKTDDKTYYSQKELSDIINGIVDIEFVESVSYTVMPFTGTDHYYYIALVKQVVAPTEFHIGMNLPEPLVGSEFEKELNRQLRSILMLFLFGILLLIAAFSRVASKKIANPLKEINRGIDNVIQGDYSTRIVFKGNHEMEQIKDAFNYMAEQLETAEYENRKIAESKKRMLLDISHDLRTPSTTIQGYAEALYKERVPEPENQKKYLKYIYDKSRHVTNCIESLFRFSKLDSSVYELDREVEDFSEFLRNVLITHYGDFEQRDFKLDFDIPEDKILYYFDKIEFERALTNIIDNVLKYNPKGTEFKVILGEHAGVINLVFEDNGVGIPDGVKDDIFNVLVRGDHTRKTDGGTGLGLAITKRIIQLHGGDIALESKEGDGTKFIIELTK